MNCPQFVKVNDKKYKINTSFRIAIECNTIAEDKNITDLERGLAIIYKLFGDEGINNPDDYEKLLQMAQKYLLCGKEYDFENNEKQDMDYVEDMDYIEASFMSDFGIDLTSEDMDWWKFNKLINGLSNSEMGNCCVLNRVRNLRNLNLNDIKDSKQREQLAKAKKMVALKKTQNKKEMTEKQKESADKLNKMLGL
jgi:hypothetical protein